MKRLTLFILLLESFFLFSKDLNLNVLYENSWKCDVVSDSRNSDLEYTMVLNFIVNDMKVLIDYYDALGKETYGYNFYLNSNEIWIYDSDKNNPAYIIKKSEYWLIESPFALSFTFGRLIITNE